MSSLQRPPSTRPRAVPRTPHKPLGRDPLRAYNMNEDRDPSSPKDPLRSPNQPAPATPSPRGCTRTSPASPPARPSARRSTGSRDNPPAGRVIYFYVVDAEGRLLGVVPTRRLILSPRAYAPDGHHGRPPATIPRGATVLEACEFFIQHRLLAFPVVDEAGRVLGRGGRRSLHGHPAVRSTAPRRWAGSSPR